MFNVISHSSMSTALFAALVNTFLLTTYATSPCSKNTPNGNKETTYFDLSYSINNDTIYYPGQKVEFNLAKDIRGYTPGGYWYATYSFCMGEHGGTHVDAPIHFSKQGLTLDEIPPSHLIDVPVTVVDVEHDVFSSSSPDSFLLQVEHLIAHESKHGEIPFRGVVLVHTGWSRFWPDKQKYLGWDNSTNTVNGSDHDQVGEKKKPVLHFPGCSEHAAKWLANERGIVGFGIDTPSVDIGDNHGNLPVHILFAERQIYNIENVANLHLVIQSIKKKACMDLRLFVLPIKITGATGGPSRILAYCRQHKT